MGLIDLGLLDDWTYLFLALFVLSIFLGAELIRTRRENRRWSEDQ